jgi:hypothetical protein
MLKYRVDNIFVEEEIFYTDLKKCYDATPQPITYENYVDLLNTNGSIRLNGKNKKNFEYHYFDRAEAQVFELEQIVVEHEYDPLDEDAFNIAFAIYQKGFRRML